MRSRRIRLISPLLASLGMMSLGGCPTGTTPDSLRTISGQAAPSATSSTLPQGVYFGDYEVSFAEYVNGDLVSQREDTGSGTITINEGGLPVDEGVVLQQGATFVQTSGDATITASVLSVQVSEDRMLIEYEGEISYSNGTRLPITGSDFYEHLSDEGISLLTQLSGYVRVDDLNYAVQLESFGVFR